MLKLYLNITFSSQPKRLLKSRLNSFDASHFTQFLKIKKRTYLLN